MASSKPHRYSRYFSATSLIDAASSAPEGVVHFLTTRFDYEPPLSCPRATSPQKISLNQSMLQTFTSAATCLPVAGASCVVHLQHTYIIKKTFWNNVCYLHASSLLRSQGAPEPSTARAVWSSLLEDVERAHKVLLPRTVRHGATCRTVATKTEARHGAKSGQYADPLNTCTLRLSDKPSTPCSH